MSEEITHKGNGAIAKETQDGEGYDWKSGKQEEPPASKYVRTDIPPIASAKFDGKAFDRGAEALTEIKTVKRLGIVNARRPKQGEWFRCHPELKATVYAVVSTSGDFYLVDPGITDEIINLGLSESLKDAFLIPCANVDDALFLWPIVVNESNQHFHESLEHVDMAKGIWLQRRWLKKAGEYETATRASKKEPKWPPPECTINDWLEKAFRGMTIDSVEHPQIKEIRGEF